ncbi:hypothetical protein H9W91_19045 [Streptomyces alfalfae]|uniref:DUF6303 family protein n=1 Tax=Streptomyces alfalfae TaxID=1642299 RepID=UPI001BA4A2CF|nr:DUF6303 family protein [Streptomyces alfalfae]QUI32716.1 hypothetical protein H9W91_19045 [Streptomyces alfalfae]
MRYSARLSNSFDNTWELYIVSDRLSVDWPELTFNRVGPVPTPYERNAAVATLGYEIVDGTQWQWQELVNGPMDRVELLAAVDVRPIGGAA